MTNTTVIAILPVGEFDSVSTKSEFDAIIETLNPHETDQIIADPVAAEESARESVRELSRRDPDLLVIIPLRGMSAPVIEAAGLTCEAPCLIYPIQGRFALPSSALAVGALREAKKPVELLYALPNHPDTIKRYRSIIQAAKAFSRIKKSRIGVIGGLYPNLVSCRYDPQIINSRLGITLVPISYEDLRSSIEITKGRVEEIKKLRQAITRSFQVSTADKSALDAGIQIHLALKRISLEHKLDGFATECWSGFPKEIGANPCMGFIEDAYSLACEGDVMLCASLMIVRYLTDCSAYVGDLYDLNQDGILTLVHCGAPASLAADKRNVVLAKSQLALDRGFETMTCRPQLDQGPVTIFRFYGREYDKLHLAMGELRSSEQSPDLKVKIKMIGNRWDFLDQCFGNHYLVATGDIRSEIKLLCKWLGITIFET